jgi:hypothetical protein
MGVCVCGASFNLKYVSICISFLNLLPHNADIAAGVEIQPLICNFCVMQISGTLLLLTFCI